MTESPRDLLHRLYDEEFGLRPTNFSIKPVHVANGLGRALTRRSYQSTALAHTLRRWVLDQRTRNQEERHPNSEILDSYPQAFATREGQPPSVEAMSTLRMLALNVLGADGAAYEDPDKSSYTMANERFITRDPSDNRTGLFLSRLLTAGVPGDAAERLMTDLADESDPWTTLALPLLSFADIRDERLEGEAKMLAGRSNNLFTVADGRLASPVLANLRDAYDQLARFEADSASKLNSVRRLVLFGCFVVHVHMIARWSEFVDDAPRPPILLDMFDGTRLPLRDASRATVRAAGDAIEGLMVARIRGECSAVTTDSKARSVIDGVVVTDELKGQLLRAYEAHREGGGLSPTEALADAFWETGLTQVRKDGGHPIGFLTELGRRAGYLTPWANQGQGGKLRKRYGVTAEFLETLIIATVEPNRPVDFPEFLDSLHDRFGIVVGRPSDDAVIRANNLHGTQFGTPTSISEEDLRRNVEELRQAAIATGYAKAYADGQTVITTSQDSLVTL